MNKILIQEKKHLKKNDVLVIDYRVGNQLSVINALEFLGYKYVISNKEEDIINADAYILPGVGAFGEAMHNLNELGITKTLNEQVLIQKKPILGLCLGMQILAEYSEEKGNHKGLGWIKGNIVKLKPDQTFKIPHVGWNNIEIIKHEPLFTRSNVNTHFYFDHSYHFVCEDEFISAKFMHSLEVVAAVQRENIFGVQFHPEKSQNSGLKLFRCFFNYVKEYNKKRINVGKNNVEK